MIERPHGSSSTHPACLEVRGALRPRRAGPPCDHDCGRPVRSSLPELTLAPMRVELRPEHDVQRTVDLGCSSRGRRGLRSGSIADQLPRTSAIATQRGDRAVAKDDQGGEEAQQVDAMSREVSGNTCDATAPPDTDATQRPFMVPPGVLGLHEPEAPRRRSPGRHGRPWHRGPGIGVQALERRAVSGRPAPQRPAGTSPPGPRAPPPAPRVPARSRTTPRRRQRSAG